MDEVQRIDRSNTAPSSKTFRDESVENTAEFFGKSSINYFLKFVFGPKHFCLSINTFKRAPRRDHPTG
jgi:hypothetical protein